MCLAIVSLAVGCKDYDDDIDDLTKQLTELQTNLEGQLSTQATTLNASIDATKQALEAKDTELETALQTLTAAAATKEELAQEVEDLKALVATKDELSAAVQTLTDASATKDELAQAVADLTALAATKDELASAIQTLADASATKEELEQAVADFTAAGEALDAKINVLTDSLANYATKAELNTLETKVTTFKATFATKTELQVQADSLTSLLGQVNLLALKVSNNEGDIADLQNEFTSLSASIEAYMAQINSVLVERLTDLKFIKELSVGGEDAINFGVITYMQDGKEVRAVKEIKVKFDVKPTTVTDAGIVLGENAGMVKTHPYVATKALAPVAPDNFPVDVIGIENGVLTFGVTLSDEVFESIPNHDPNAMSEDALAFTFYVRHSDEAMLGPVISDVEFNGEENHSSVPSEEIRVYKTVDQVDIVRPYESTVVACNDSLKTNGGVSGVEDLAVSDQLVVNIPVSSTGNIVTRNLLDSVAPLVSSNLSALNFTDVMTKENLAKYGLKFHFDLLDNEGTAIEYLVNTKDQQAYINLSDADMGTVNSQDVSETDLAIGKTPIVHVSILDMNNDNAVVTEAFVKVAFAPETISVDAGLAILAECPKDDTLTGTTMKLTTTEMDSLIYNKLVNSGLAKADFRATYTSANYTLYLDGVAQGTNDLDAQGNPAAGTMLGTLSENTVDGTYAWTITEDNLYEAIINQNFAVSGETLQDEQAIKLVLTFVDPTGLYPNVVINYDAVWNAPSDNFNIAATDLISNVWDLTNTSITQHTVNPSASSIHPSDCTYVNDILVTFAGNAFPTGLNDPKFAFSEDQDAMIVDGETYVFTVSGDGSILYASDSQNNTAPVATMTGTYNQTVTYSDSDIAKLLLNTGMMSAKVIVTGVNCLGQALNNITINGEDYFTINFLRPVSISEVLTTEYLYDSENFGTDKQIIGLDELAHLYDWRLGIEGYDDDLSDFLVHDNYYDYYDVTSISVDATKVKTDMNQADGGFVLLSSVTNAVHITQYQPTDAVAGVYTLTGVNNSGATITQDVQLTTYPRGLIAYNSNGTVITQEFKLQIPVTVNYLWGSTSTMVTVIVKP